MTQPPHSFVATLDNSQGDKLLHDLKKQEFEIISSPPTPGFRQKKRGSAAPSINRANLLFRGKRALNLLNSILSPKFSILLAIAIPLPALTFTPRIGIDESGKGDFFGPLCIAGVFVQSSQFEVLQAMGVKDSKSLTDQDASGNWQS